MDNKLKFKVIDCGKRIYIKDESGNYYSSIPNLLFDGIQAEKTYKDGWYKLPNVPQCVQKARPTKDINIRYQLKAGYKTIDIMPEVIHLDSLYESEFEEVSGLYERKCDKEDQGVEDVEFDIDVIYKKDDFEWVKTKYRGCPDLIAEIEIHPAVLQEYPQSLTSDQMFDVIRSYVKSNINAQVAKISSDYDFHFQVERKIMLAEPYSYNVDTNAMNKRKKPNWVKKWVESKQETILNIKRKASDSFYGTNCVLAPAIAGANAVDLENKVNDYLEKLMKEINKQYNECPHCKGWGVMEVENG
jgi:hypothetical protein